MSLARLLVIPLTLLPLTAPMPAKAQSAPQAVIFAPGAVSIEGGNVFRGAFSPDGREFWFFRKVTEGEEDYRIFVSRLEDGEWGPAERVLLGGEFSELYPSIWPDGKRMVFASYRPIPGDPSDHPNAISPGGTEILFARGFALYWSVPAAVAISSP